MEVTAALSIDTTEDVLKLNEEQTEEKDEFQKTFVSPPEYDENYSRWTLKHREPADGLVELMEHSGVYVNAENLAECENLSSDSNRLAQLLLTEIFTISALSNCSWPGANANVTEIDDGYATPSLDKHAANILLKFVQEYAQMHDWELMDCHCIVKSLRQIMLHMRQKELALTTKWTLKYREPAEGLVELIENSGVYVNADRLAQCMMLSNDCVTLARMLLSEIFTINALSTCSLTDTSTKADDTKQNVTNIRPVLDENAISILLIFAVEYGQEKGWEISWDEQTYIENSIRQKMEVLRRVEKKIEEEEDHDKVLKKFWCLGVTTLSPEYDAENSRWTLKYREVAPGLIELMAHSGVYVNADRLAECKEGSNDCVTLAQKLLTEVFTTSALGTCSLSINNEKCYEFVKRRQGFNFKPELDAYAEIILLNFVDEYGLEKGWPVLDFRTIKMGMTEVMREMEEQYSLKLKELAIPALDKLYITEL